MESSERHPQEEAIIFKLNLKSKNSKINYPDDAYFLKKNSNLKKNTGFVKKIKSFTESNKESIIKEMFQLNLSRFVEEIAGAIVDSKLKVNDISSMLELCTEFNQLYQEFSKFLMEQFKKQFNSYKEDKVSTKVKVDMKLFVDLVIIDILPSQESMKVLYTFINHLINSDTEDFGNLSILIHFLKNCGYDLLGYLPKSIILQIDCVSYIKPILAKEIGEKFNVLFSNYYENIVSKLKDLHKSMLITRDANNRILLSKGEVSKEREERLTGYKDRFEKLNQFCVQLADLLNKEMPELQEIDIEDAMNDPTGIGGADGELDMKDSDISCLFEDDEIKSFYMNLCDLKAILPGICYKDIEKVEEKEEDEDVDIDGEIDVETVEKELENELDQEVEGMIDSIEDNDKVVGGADNEEECTTVSGAATGTTTKSISVKQPLDNFINMLSNCINRDMIDKASQEFCEQYNTKSNRTKLAKELFNVPRTRLDLLPFYARLVANLNQITNDVAKDINQLLMRELKWHIHKRIQNHLESKIKTVRFIGELVKFRVFKKHDALYCIRMLLHNFKHHNIDMACALLESCGRFLYRSRSSHNRTTAYLSIIMKKKTINIIDQRYSTMIDNAYYYCNPPDVDYSHILELENLTNTEKYLRKLLYDDLNKHSSDKVFKSVRKFDWKDEKFMSFAIRTFTEVWRVKYNNVPFLASVLAGLAPFHEYLVVSVIDNIIEEIRVGMEINERIYNQNRIAAIRYLGNFYVFKLINAGVIFNVLYTLIAFGVAINNPNDVQLDSEDSFFRINLIHTLLESCGRYFRQGNIGRKLDIFFMYLQRFFLYKKQLESNSNLTEADNSDKTDETGQKPKTPHEALVEYQIFDMIKSLRPKCKIYKTYEVCQESIEKFEAECLKKLQSKKIYLQQWQQGQQANDTGEGLGAITEEDGEEDDYDDDDDDDGRETPTNETTDDYDTTEDQDECETMNVSAKPRTIECIEDEEFLKLVDQVQVDSIHQPNKGGMKTNISIPIPIHIKSKTEALINSNLNESSTTVPYSIITKKGGGKNQYLELQVPRDVVFVSRLIETAHNIEEQRKTLNKVVLAMHHVQQQEEMNGPSDMMATSSADRYNKPGNKNIQVPHKGVPDINDMFRSTGNRRK